ncbi:MAG: C10 family peptidase [Alistipes sp.]
MKKLSYILPILMLFVSCVKNETLVNRDKEELGIQVELSDIEFASIAFDSPKELTEDIAKDILINFIKSEQKGSLTRVGSVPSISLIEKSILQTGNKRATTKSSTSMDDMIRTSVYEFKISDGENEGFALVSGDERSPALVAYVPKFDEITYSECGGAHIMLEHAKASHLSDIVFIENLKDSLRDKTYVKISEKLNIPVKNLTYEIIKDKIKIAGETITRSSPVTTPPTRIYSFVYPLITTKWNQHAPYNSKHPDIVINKNTGEKGKPYAGCVPISIAQVFVYLEVPGYKALGQTINWKTLKATETISNTAPQATRDMVGNLLYEVGENTGVDYRYSSSNIHNGTWTTFSTANSYANRIINTGATQNYNWTVVQNSLLAREPVLIQGQGHGWILDGYAVCKKSGTAGASQYDTYVTTNFGWEGFLDGYYKLNDDYSANFHGSYQTAQLSIVPNCRKK